jgi:membrane-bound lytic murein transglycosylase D
MAIILCRPVPVSLAVVLCLGLACASRRMPERALPVAPPPTVPEAVPPAPPPNFDHLYERIAAHDALYDEGVELIASGEEVAGEERIGAAANGLLADAEACLRLAGCDMRTFLEAFNRLLTQQGIALKREALRVVELEQATEEDLEREPGTAPFAAPMPELERATSLLKGTELREIIALNGPVKAALDDWLTWMRPMLLDTYHNYQFLRAKMAPVYEEAGLPEALLFAMLATETGAKVHSFSRAGAAGPLQFMRRTGQAYGLHVVDGFDMRLDPTAATRANVRYLNDRFGELGESLEMALAAYNGGEGRALSLQRRYGSNVWDSRVYWSLPEETREYVPRVLAAAWLFLHPEEYGLEFPRVDGSTTMLALRSEISLAELSVCLGQRDSPNGWFRTLRNLNPRLSPGDRIAAGESIEFPNVLLPVYEERCVEGDLLARARDLHGASYPPEPEVLHYQVRRGDTLGKIVSRHKCASLREIADLNRLRAPKYVIHPGQTLKIPTCSKR